jgi:ATP-dependent phosphofructokinase / diphosphate-dependent phosphofructokinase
VVAEGAELPEGGMVGQDQQGAQAKLGGIGHVVAAEIERRLHRETRTSVLGHLQRGGAPTTFDRVLATQYGSHAVRLIIEKRFGEMVCYQPPEVLSVPITEAVDKLRQVDPRGSAVQAARALGISFGDRPADESPFGLLVESPDIATADDVELDAEFTLDLAEAAAEEALS